MFVSRSFPGYQLVCTAGNFNWLQLVTVSFYLSYFIIPFLAFWLNSRIVSI